MNDKKLLNIFVEKINDIVNDGKINDSFRINSIEFNPRFEDRIFFDVDIYESEIKNNQLNNQFFIFFIQYYFKKIDIFMENFIEKEHLYDFINKMYNELKEMDIEIEGIKNQNTFFQINFNSLSKDVSIFCSNLLIKIRKQIEQLYFYIYQLFQNWLYNNNLQISKQFDWSQFFDVSSGW